MKPEKGKIEAQSSDEVPIPPRKKGNMCRWRHNFIIFIVMAINLLCDMQKWVNMRVIIPAYVYISSTSVNKYFKM